MSWSTRCRYSSRFSRLVPLLKRSISTSSIVSSGSMLNVFFRSSTASSLVLRSALAFAFAFALLCAAAAFVILNALLSSNRDGAMFLRSALLRWSRWGLDML